jgi:hypothetical protein
MDNYYIYGIYIFKHKNFRQDHLLNQDPDQDPRCPDLYPTKKVLRSCIIFIRAKMVTSSVGSGIPNLLYYS